MNNVPKERKMTSRKIKCKNSKLKFLLVSLNCIGALLSGSIEASEQNNKKLCVNILLDQNILSGYHLHAPSLEKVNKELEIVCGWLEQFKHDKTSYKNARISIKSHAFLNAYADTLSKLPEAQLDNLIDRAKQLWKELDGIKAPPSEIKLIPGSDEEKFAKINRGLFQDLDAKLYGLARGTEKPKDCANPIVEWAENVIDNFSLQQIKKGTSPLNIEEIIEAIKKGYRPENLAKFLAQSWPIVYKNIEEHGNNKKKSEEIFRQLDTNLCYPARKSMTIATALLPHHNGIGFAEAFSTEHLLPYFDDFVLKRCQKFDSTITQQSIEYKCGKHEKEFCHKFWEDFSKGYKTHLSENYDISSMPEKDWSKENMHSQILHWLGQLGTTADELCVLD